MESDRIWIYSRKSRALGDPDDPDLLASHRSAMLDLAKRRGVTVPAENVVLEAGSGETIAERPSFQKLLRRWEALPSDSGGAVLVTMIDRLSRGDHADQGRIQKALSRADIHIWTPSREYNLRDVDASFMFDVEALFARRELSLFKKRMSLARDKLTRDGRSTNLIAPYGYVTDRLAKTWQPHPERFEIVRAWCREAHQDSLLVIADRWGVPYDLVLRTIRNPSIAGWPVRRYRTTTERKRVRVRNPEEWIWPERQGDYPPIISLEEWRTLQAAIDRRRTERSKRGGHVNGWARDVVIFAGHEDRRVRLSSQFNGGATARRQIYEIVTAAGQRIYIDRPVVHAAALDALAALFRRPRAVERLANDYLAARATERTVPSSGEDRAEAQKTLIIVRRKLVRVEEQILETDDEERLLALTTLRERLGTEAKGLTRRLQSAPEVIPANEAMDTLIPLLEEILPHLRDYLQAMVEEQDHEALYTLTTGFLKAIMVDVRANERGTRYSREVVDVVYRWKID